MKQDQETGNRRMQAWSIDCQQYCKVFSVGNIVFLTTVTEIIGHSCTKKQTKLYRQINST